LAVIPCGNENKLTNSYVKLSLQKKANSLFSNLAEVICLENLYLNESLVVANENYVLWIRIKYSN